MPSAARVDRIRLRRLSGAGSSRAISWIASGGLFAPKVLTVLTVGVFEGACASECDRAEKLICPKGSALRQYLKDQGDSEADLDEMCKDIRMANKYGGPELQRRVCPSVIALEELRKQMPEMEKRVDEIRREYGSDGK